MIYMVARNCCTSGNCTICAFIEGHRVGQFVLVPQFMTCDKVTADKCAENFHEYKAVVVEATDENIAKLHEPRHREWAVERREKLSVA